MEKRLVFALHINKTARTLLGVCVVAFALFNFAFPKKTDKVDFRQITAPVAVKLNPFSLPFAALEDEHLDADWVSDEPQVLSVVTLKAGSMFNINLLRAQPVRVEWAMTREAPRQLPTVQVGNNPLLIVPEIPNEEVQPRRIQLKPLVLSKFDVNVAKLLPVHVPEGLKQTLQPTQQVVARALPPERIDGSVSSSGVAQVQDDHGPVAQIEKDVRHLDDLGFDEYADMLVKRELAWREQQASPGLRARSRDSESSRVIVGLPQETQSATSGSTSASTSASIMPAPPISAMKSRPMQEASPVTVSHTKLQGTLEFADGLALTSADQQVIVQHYLDGQSVEDGQVHMQQGRFTIRVQDPQGSLVAKLLDETGEVIGRGEVAISGDAHHIKMRLVNGVKGAVVSAYSFGRTPIYVPDAKVHIEAPEHTIRTDKTGPQVGHFEHVDLLPGSSFIVRAEKDGFWGTVMMGSSDESLQVPLFPNSMMEALIREAGVRDKELAQRKGIIWGRVTRGGKPVEGAQVVLDGAGNYNPVYFLPVGSLLLPDLTRTTTSENGYFALVHVDTGLRGVQVRIPGETDLAQDVLVESRHVSQLNFDVSPQRQVDVEVTDAFDFRRRLNAQVAWNDSNDILGFDATQPSPQMSSFTGSGLMYVEANAGPTYWPLRQSFGRAAQTFHTTPVSIEWVQRVAQQAGVRIDMQQGLVFGLVDGPDFLAELETSVAYSSMNRVYFDSAGNLTPVGKSGGGFLFFNVPVGAQTVTLQPENGNRRGLRVVPVEAGRMNVIHYQFPDQPTL